eukprot:614581-Rhodomonas_salina.1
MVVRVSSATSSGSFYSVTYRVTYHMPRVMLGQAGFKNPLEVALLTFTSIDWEKPAHATGKGLRTPSTEPGGSTRNCALMGCHPETGRERNLSVATSTRSKVVSLCKTIAQRRGKLLTPIKIPYDG